MTVSITSFRKKLLEDGIVHLEQPEGYFELLRISPLLKLSQLRLRWVVQI